MDDRICAVCGESGDEHHEFIPAKIPEGCQCDIFEWGNPMDIPPVCTKYEGTSSSYCIHCEHDEVCHNVTLSTKEV